MGDRIPIIKTTPESLNNFSSVNISDYIEYDTIDDELIYLNRSKLRNEIYMDELEKDNLLDVRPIKMTNRY